MLKKTTDRDYQSPLTEILTMNALGILCESMTEGEGNAEGFTEDSEIYGW